MAPGDDRAAAERAEDLDLAVARVLPALNLDPGSWTLPAGFLQRASRRARPAALTLAGVNKLLVYVGVVREADPSAAAEDAAQAALSSLSDASRAASTKLIVAWTDPGDTVSAAAFDVGASDGSVVPLGYSWLTPDRWPRPMIDPSRADERRLDESLERVAQAIAGRGSSGDFEADFARSTRLVDLELLHRGGEGQSVRLRPDAGAPDEQWDVWIERYARSALDEWRRTGGPATSIEVQAPAADGPLAGMQVFVSYARPDATSVASPVREALRKAGASVWFDQERSPDEELLDAGLAGIIGACDAYVMCATDEFVERAGYATQEVAWAVKGGDRERRLVVVAEAGTVLPTVVAAWPLVALESSDLAGRLAEALRAPPPELPDLPPPKPSPAPPALAPEADLPALRSRVAHVLRFDEVRVDDVTELAAGRGKHLSLVRRRLLDVGDGLQWSGTLADIDSWPSDPVIRDLRWRLAGDRALVGTRGALTESWTDSPNVSGDVRRLALKPVPIARWPAANGWGDDERRFALRHHASRLRVLEELIERGLCLGLLLGANSVPDPVLDEWAAGLRERRRECLDTLLALRLDERLSWATDLPTWDKLFGAWMGVLENLPRTAAPGPRAFLRAAAEDAAAVGAETTWRAATHCTAAVQSFNKSALAPPTPIDMYAVPAGQPAPSSGDGRRVLLGVAGDASGGARIELTWRGFDDDAPAGTAAMPAPATLAQAIARRSRATSSGVHRSGLT